MCLLITTALYWVRYLTFFFQLVFISGMATLSSCLIGQIISFIFPANEYGSVYPRLTEDADFGKKIIFSDEAHFDLGGYVNKQNCRIWGTENPQAYIEKPMQPKRVTVWCGFWCRGITFWDIFLSKISKQRSL